MKVLLINGSPHKDGCTFTALNEVAKTLEKNGIESEILYLGVKPIAGCIACGKCFEQKKCVFDDKVNEILARCDEFDGLVIGSPVNMQDQAANLERFWTDFFMLAVGDLPENQALLLLVVVEVVQLLLLIN